MRSADDVDTEDDDVGDVQCQYQIVRSKKVKKIRLK